jgi:hypothetical protein
MPPNLTTLQPPSSNDRDLSTRSLQEMAYLLPVPHRLDLSALSNRGSMPTACLNSIHASSHPPIGVKDYG